MYRLYVGLTFGIALYAVIPAVNAQSDETGFARSSEIAIAVSIVGSEVAYGDLIALDQETGSYFSTQYARDPRVVGVAAENPAVVLYSASGTIPIIRSGQVLMNVTLENGPIQPGDRIIASSIPGKGMKASPGEAYTVAIAREAFDDKSPSIQLMYEGKQIAGGTIIADLSSTLGLGSGISADINKPGSLECDPNALWCRILAKVDAAPLVTLMRYVIAAAVALGSLYMAFRSFMANAVNGIISVGRNPLAKSSIQAMIVFNALLAGGIALLGLGVGLMILFVPIL